MEYSTSARTSTLRWFPSYNRHPSESLASTAFATDLNAASVPPHSDRLSSSKVLTWHHTSRRCRLPLISQRRYEDGPLYHRARVKETSWLMKIHRRARSMDNPSSCDRLIERSVQVFTLAFKCPCDCCSSAVFVDKTDVIFIVVACARGVRYPWTISTPMVSCTPHFL